MRGRAIGLGLLGLGAFLLTGALAVRLFLEPALVKLPLDQTAEPTAVGSDVSYFDLSAQRQLRDLEADVQQNVIGDPTAPEADEDVAVWNYGSTIHDVDGGGLLNAGTYRVCIDRRSAEAVECESTHIDYDREATIEGLTLTFPFGTEQRDYDVFNTTTRQAWPATFEGTEEMGGLEVYRFQLSIPETVVRTTTVPGKIVGEPDEENVEAEVVYSNERTIWVEPTSGVIVTSEERPNTVLRAPGGDTEVTLLAGTFAGTEDTIAAGIERAEGYRSQISLVTTTLPLIFAGVGLLVLLLGVLLVRRATPRDDEEFVETGRHTHRVPQVQ